MKELTRQNLSVVSDAKFAKFESKRSPGVFPHDAWGPMDLEKYI